MVTVNGNGWLGVCANLDEEQNTKGTVRKRERKRVTNDRGIIYSLCDASFFSASKIQRLGPISNVFFFYVFWLHYDTRH